MAGLQHNHLLNLHAHRLATRDMSCWPLESGCRQSPFAASGWELATPLLPLPLQCTLGPHCCASSDSITDADVKPAAHLAAKLAPVNEHARCRHIQLFQPQCRGQGQRQRHVEVGLKDLPASGLLHRLTGWLKQHDWMPVRGAAASPGTTAIRSCCSSWGPRTSSDSGSRLKSALPNR